MTQRPTHGAVTAPAPAAPPGPLAHRPHPSPAAQRGTAESATPPQGRPRGRRARGCSRGQRGREGGREGAGRARGSQEAVELQQQVPGDAHGAGGGSWHGNALREREINIGDRGVGFSAEGIRGLSLIDTGKYRKCSANAVNCCTSQEHS